MATNNLSIIIPCYNCAKTLREAVESCYTQDLSNEEFEIVMVDDGSQDNTREVMEELARQHENIRLFYHEENRGGGAARNTGIQNSNGGVVYCLDSDNFFAKGTVKKILNHIRETGMDGACFEDRRFFVGNDAKRYVSKKTVVKKESFVLADLFTTDAVLLDNFFYTRAAYDKTDGYPEHHGFDTQTFEMRYLLANNTVVTAPGSVFYHRQAMQDESYFEREYNKGSISLNTYLALEDIIHVLSDEAVLTVINYDYVENADMTNNLLNKLKELHSKGALFGTAEDEYAQAFQNSIRLYHDGKHADSLHELTRCAIHFGPKKILVHNVVRNIQALSVERQTEKDVLDLIQGIMPRQRMLYKWYHRNSFLNKIIGYVRSFLRQGKIMQKIKSLFRHLKSLIVYPFIIRDNAVRYRENHKKLIERFQQKNQGYDYEQFLMPAWEKYRLHIQERFLSEPGFAFLRDPIIKSTMFFAHTTPGEQYELDLIKEVFGEDRAKELLKENTTGVPILNNLHYRTSGNSIHLLAHLAHFQKITGVSVADMNTVVEHGGGYGSMAKICKRLNPGVTYIIFDIPIFSYLQMAYLASTLGEDEVVLVEDAQIAQGKVNIVPLDNNVIKDVAAAITNVDMFLSTWALSESNAATHALVKSLNYFGAKHLLLAHQHNNNNFPFATNIAELGDVYTVVHHEEIEHLKNNKYLFAHHK